MIILITGVPGTGKTSIAKELVKLLKGKELDLLELSKKYKNITGYDEEKNSFIVNEYRISAMIQKEVKNSKDIFIIASHLSHFVKPSLTKLCVVLRCNPNELRKRLKKRGYDKNKIDENIMCEYLDTCLIEALDVGHKRHLHEIDTTNKNPKNVAKEIIDILNRKKEKSYGKIKWLEDKI